jgi:2-polyprenyl-3-methyl-5-hydroxy-6-metoxy-1,4-benzoquinol methylase
LIYDNAYPPPRKDLLSSKYKNDGRESVKLSEIQKAAKSNVKKKIETNIYSFEYIDCPICESTDYHLLAQKDRYGLPINTVICKKCGLLMANPVMTQESLNKFYSEDYRELYIGSKKAPYSYFQEQYEHGKSIIDFIKSNYEISFYNLFVLEIGCGAGGILSAFKNQGAEILGFDLGADYLEYGIKKHDLNLKQGSIQDYDGDKPDVLIYSHVLEHVRLPDEVLRIKRICHANTFIYIEVPGLLNVHKFDPNFIEYLHIAHLYHFSLNTLRCLLSKHGFTFLCGDEVIRSLFIVDNSTMHINEKPNGENYVKHISFLEKIEKHRLFYITLNMMRKKIFFIFVCF